MALVPRDIVLVRIFQFKIAHFFNYYYGGANQCYEKHSKWQLEYDLTASCDWAWHHVTLISSRDHSDFQKCAIQISKLRTFLHWAVYSFGALVD